MKRKYLKHLDNNRGSVINLALLILIVLTLIVIYMNDSTTTDVEIAVNEKYQKTAFYNADAGLLLSLETIEFTYINDRNPTNPILNPYNPDTFFSTLDSQLHAELNGWGTDPDTTNDPEKYPEATFTVDTNPVYVDIWRDATGYGAGGSIEWNKHKAGSGSIRLKTGVNVIALAQKNARQEVGAIYDYAL